MREQVDFAYQISDERLLAYSRMPLLDRLKWLDEVRLFTLMMREAPKGALDNAQAAGQESDRGA